MSGLTEQGRGAYLQEDDILLVTDAAGDNDPAIYLALRGNGDVIAFNGHVDLGTGIRTALAQIAAEELDIPFERVRMVLGSTGAAPDQGPTIASETIQITAKPLRLAAATARRYLLDLAAAEFGVIVDDLVVDDGVVSTVSDKRSIPYEMLISGRRIRLELDAEAAVKPVEAHRLVGRSQPRNDIAAKARGDWTYVHDVRVAGMLHGRVVRPPYVGYDHGAEVGNSLISVDESSVADIPGLVRVVVSGDFVGIVASREEFAAKAAEQLVVHWKVADARPDLNNPEEALRGNRSTRRVLTDRGDVERGLEAAATKFERTYVWPYQMHGSIGPSCAVADWRPEGMTVWSGTQNPFWIRRDLARLLDMDEGAITVERFEAAGCYGRNCADDVTADAALLSRAVGAPVRVQLTRAQEHGWEPKGAAQLIDVRGGLDNEGGPAAYDFETSYPSNLSPTLALILTGKLPPTPDTAQMGDRTAIPPYAIGNMRIAVHDMPPIARASWFRGVSAMPNSFAHESFMDELAFAAEVDPVEYKLRYLTDPRAIDLVKTVAERAQWTPRTRWGSEGREGDVLYGRGFAYALYVHGTFPGTPAAWSAWVADVAVNRRTGEIAVTKVTVGQDSGMMINPDGVRHQIHGNVIQSVSRVLKEKVTFSSTAVESVEWGGYPILTFEEVPDIDVVMIPRQNEEPLGVGESASVPSAAAIVNAVYDATGIRFRELPLTPDKVLAALDGREQNALRLDGKKTRKRAFKWGFGLAGLAGLSAVGLATLSPIRPAIATIERPDPSVFSPASIERGRLVAAAGGCAVCHVGADGRGYAGGRAFDTPFGTVRAANISPDAAHGIGGWSYAAFVRAMREGISRDGSHLYPVHPYTSFVNVEDKDLQDLYAYMMSGTAVAEKPETSNLKFPFAMRGLMAGWNGLFLRPAEIPYDPAKGETWNRGAYLVEGLGHCSACHSDRNVLGAEIRGPAHLAGGFADHWTAPALTAASKSPVGWTKAALFAYLRHGHASDHGSAGGPMADVIRSLSGLPDADIEAMATYLAGIGGDVSAEQATSARDTALRNAGQARPAAALAYPEGARIFSGACSACHETDGMLASLALNSNLHDASPVNVLQSILHGAEAPASLASTAGADTEVMTMPAFRDNFSDRQIGELVGYLRARFAPGEKPWEGLADSMTKMRGAEH
ncbi:molybdopterin cofactor-binding domain-containing protein [Rhizobium halophytocola]|uniref:Nicotinate dehydrogenase subunit B n=1 Tax=Rhizobium halophytocola TaxID=735519 RepID=A0ABS4DU42_9HYPH|nr:molybdopterin cofactor-binding domain-containing protein [Rhizobium halophytocola]MBP1849187.1 nicotinate dehydrogenase subunit B [Rhizobium halophytocola]